MKIRNKNVPNPFSEYFKCLVGAVTNDLAHATHQKTDIREHFAMLEHKSTHCLSFQNLKILIRGQCYKLFYFTSVLDSIITKN